MKNEEGKTTTLEVKDVKDIKVGTKVTIDESKVTIMKGDKIIKQIPHKEKLGFIEWN